MAKRRRIASRVSPGLKKISFVVPIVLLALFLGSIITLKRNFSSARKNAGDVLGLSRHLAFDALNQLRDASSGNQNAESENGAASSQFDGGESNGSSPDDGGGTAVGGGEDGGGTSVGTPGTPGEPEEDGACDADGVCRGEYIPDPTEAETESEDMVGNTDFRANVDIESPFTEEMLEESLERISGIIDQILDEDVEVASVSGFVALIRHEIAATVSIPLEVDLETKGLVTKTKTGIKKIDVFPDQAMEEVLSTKELSRVDPPKPIDKIQKDNTVVSGVINLKIRDDAPVYEISGVKDHKVLGFIPVSTRSTVYVSAEGGRVVGRKQSTFAGVVGFLSTK